MAVLTTSAFLSKWESLFPSTGNKSITALRMREFRQDIADSFQSIAGATTITSWKDPCIVATTANITLSGEQTIDGVVTSSSRVLVKDQATASQNGIYISSSGTWTRATDADSASELEGAAVGVTQGTVNKNSVWLQTADNITLGTTDLAWQQIGFGSVESPAERSIDLYGRTFEDFTQGPVGYFNLVGFNNGGGIGATATTSTFGCDDTERCAGVLAFSTSTSTAGGSALANTTYKLSFGKGFRFSLAFRAALSALSDGTDTYKCRVGFADSFTTTPTNGAYFRYTHGTNGGRWEAVTVSAGVETAEDTGVAAEASTFHVFKVVSNPEGTQIDFYIDDVLTNSITTNIPTTGAFCGQVATIEKTAGATARTLYLDYYEFLTERTTAR